MSNIQRDAVLPLKSDAYASFDPLSLKEYFKKRLNDSGVFTEQNTEGSNLAVINDFMSMAFGSLLFYLNRTSTEGMFTEADIYENMNRIVKQNDYNPQGFHTANLNFSLSANADLPQGAYTIPRYSYINVVGDIYYSFVNDFSIVKTSDELEYLEEPSTQQLLYQGKFREHPTITALGDNNELIYIATDSNTKVDHFNVHVYVQRVGTSTWTKWNETASLYLEKPNTEKYEIRFNENKRYELKFGDDINGSKLQQGDQVAVFYLSTLSQDGEVGSGALNGSDLVPYNSLNYISVVLDSAGLESVLADEQFSLLEFKNPFPSTYSSDPESVDQIRKNAPKAYRSQYRLVTDDDFTNYVKTNFANLLQDAIAVDNTTFVNGYMKKMFDYGVADPSRESRILFNQVNFADACNFNNVYIIATPRQVSDSPFNSFLTTAQKQLIINTIINSKVKVHTVEPVIMDPLYIAFDIGLPLSEQNISMTDIGVAEIVVEKDPFSRVDNSSIINRINDIITDYFARKNVSLGMSVDIFELNRAILSIDGVKSFRTQRTDNANIYYEGLSFISFSEVYGLPRRISSRFNLDFFEFAYLKSAVLKKIRITNSSASLKSVQY